MISWGWYQFKASLCLGCKEAKHPNGEDLTQRFDDLYNGIETVPDTAEDFIDRCKQAEADVIDDNSVDESATAPMVEVSQMDSDGKRKLQMDKKLKTWLVEPDGTKKEISCREICEQFDGNLVMQLRAGIDSGGDISTVELDN